MVQQYMLCTENCKVIGAKKIHGQKGKDYSAELQKLLDSGNLNALDNAVAQALYADLQKALAGK